MPPESSFQPEQSNAKQSMVLEYAHIPLDAKDGLASFLEVELNSIISKSPMDVAKNKSLPKGYPNDRTTSCTQTILNSFKVSEVFCWGNKAIRKCRLYIQKFKSVGCPSYHSSKKTDPSNPHKQHLYLVVDYRSPNKEINAANNGNSVISYYLLSTITDPLARL